MLFKILNKFRVTHESAPVKEHTREYLMGPQCLNIDIPFVSPCLTWLLKFYAFDENIFSSINNVFNSNYRTIL